MGYTLAEIADGAGRVAGAAGRGFREFWFSLSLQARRRLALAAGVVVALILVLVIAVPALPCAAPGGDICPPSDDAIHLVPADAIAYVHVNADRGTEQFQEAEKVASRVPLITRQAIGRALSRLPSPGGGAPDFSRDIEPWFGGEAALAIVPAGGRAAEEVELIEAGDQNGARKFAKRIAAGPTKSTPYRGVDVSVDRRGLATALVRGFLVIGPQSGVRDVIDAQSGAKGTGSLAGDPAASAARDALPDKRLADAYLSKDGIARLVASPRGSLATFAAAVNPGASRGVAVALVANDDGLAVDVRSELDPARSKAHPGFFSAFPTFRPTLPGSLQEGSLGYLGIGDPGQTLRSLLKQATVEQPGLAAAVGNLLGRVKQLGKVDLQKNLLPSLGGEAAFALQPNPRAGGGQAAGAPAPSASSQGLPRSQSPFLEFIGADVNTGKTGTALTRLEAPIAKALAPTAGHRAPAFNRHKVGDVTVHSLRLSPTLDLTYAIAESALVVATDPSGVAQVVAGEGGLDGVDLFKSATGGLPNDVSVLGYLNLEGLISLAERAGLASDPAYATFAPEIHKLGALGLAVRNGPDELATDVQVVVG